MTIMQFWNVCFYDCKHKYNIQDYYEYCMGFRQMKKRDGCLFIPETTKKALSLQSKNCSRDSSIWYCALNCSFCKKIESGFVTDTDYLKTASMNEG